jgi:hypothetical protein
MAAIVAGLAALVGAFHSARVQRALRREDIAAKGLRDQLAGWKNLSDAKGEWLEELREEYEKRLAALKADYEGKIASLREEMAQRDRRCNERISALETRLRQLGARIDDISAAQ